MIVSEFETLRAGLAAFRGGVTVEFSGVKTEISGIKTELATLRVMINAKPDTSTIYQVLAIVAAVFAMFVDTAVVLKNHRPDSLTNPSSACATLTAA